MPTKTEWTSVKERLPEEEGRYLTLVPTPWNRKYRPFVIQDRYFKGHDTTGTWWELEGVTHWMPLPAPPEMPLLDGKVWDEVPT